MILPFDSQQNIDLTWRAGRMDDHASERVDFA